MEINWTIISIVGVLVIILIVFLIRRNQRDEKELTEKLNNDYKTTPEADSELNDEDVR